MRVIIGRRPFVIFARRDDMLDTHDVHTSEESFSVGQTLIFHVQSKI